MVPDSQLNFLHADAATAVMLALDGKVGEGMDVLLAGLRRFEERAPEAAWADELAGCYRKAINGYRRRFGGPVAFAAELPDLVYAARG